ncbi:MAG: hypothetical protein ABSC30_01570 [Acidimicrobiales bacterium]|jgi:hypothetical protein
MRKGWGVVLVVTAATTAAVLLGGVASATTVRVRTHHVSGTVSSVNGSTTPGLCGRAGTGGDFTLPTNSSTYTVDVGATSTTFKEKGVTSPSFANVCVGDTVRATGPASTDDAIPAADVVVTPPHPQALSGTVASVDGSGTPGACGVAGRAGDFTLPTKNTTYTVDVGATSTTFKEKGMSAPSFADVCVGDAVRAAGPVSTGGVVNATSVTVIPPHSQALSGTVASVDGSGTPGACGVAGRAGDFTLPTNSSTYTVDVGATSTAFKEKGMSAPSFADVCVGEHVDVAGPVSTGDVVNATLVTVTPARAKKVSGTVASVNGSTTPGVCGSAGRAGDFTVPTKSTTYIVDVATTTPFVEKGVTAPSFADVCVGEHVGVAGPVSTGDVVNATSVTVTPARAKKVSGTVASVNGSTRCGTAGTAGTFTVTSHSTTYTMKVQPTATTFKEHGVRAPSFGTVCAGDKVRTIDAVSGSDNLTATQVIVIPTK